MSPEGALVLFSGGQDSSVCLAWALAHYARVETIGFDYGQRHIVEMQAREVIRDNLVSRWPQLGPDHRLDIKAFGAIGETAMTSERVIEVTERGLPSTFVPGRNLVFLTYAAAVADRRGLSVLVGGMCETDFSGYPDCRPEFIASFRDMLSFAIPRGPKLLAPLQTKSKPQIAKLAKRLGLQRHDTWSCYRPKISEAGFVPCNSCDACKLHEFAWQGLK